MAGPLLNQEMIELCRKDFALNKWSEYTSLPQSIFSVVLCHTHADIDWGLFDRSNKYTEVMTAPV